MSTFDVPPPDLGKLLAAWEEWERGTETPGKVLSRLKTAGLPLVLQQLVDTGWTASAASTGSVSSGSVNTGPVSSGSVSSGSGASA